VVTRRRSVENLEELDQTAREIETVTKAVLGVTSALSELLSDGSDIDVAIRRTDTARHALNLADGQMVVSTSDRQLQSDERTKGPRKDHAALEFSSSDINGSDGLWFRGAGRAQSVQ